MVHEVALVMAVPIWTESSFDEQSSARRSYVPAVRSKAREAPEETVSVESSQSAPQDVSVVGEMYTVQIEVLELLTRVNRWVCVPAGWTGGGAVSGSSGAAPGLPPAPGSAGTAGLAGAATAAVGVGSSVEKEKLQASAARASTVKASTVHRDLISGSPCRGYKQPEPLRLPRASGGVY